jgi:hypothetical protein
MYVGHGFGSKEILKVHEDCPSKRTNRKNIKVISISQKEKDTENQTVPHEIQRLLDSIPCPEEILVIEVDYMSRILRIPNLERFENVEYCHIAGRRIKYYDAIYNFKSLRSLFIVNYKENDLTNFPVLSLEFFRLIRGSTTSIEIKTKYALLQNCTKLIDMCNSNIKHLTLESCNKFSHETLKDVIGLEVLDILGYRGVLRFDWIRNCDNLKSITVTATPGSRMLLNELQDLNLERIWLSISNKLVIEISKKNRDAIVTNGDVWCFNGEIDEGRVLYERFYADELKGI